MSEAEELVSYVFKWHTVVDARTCERCLGLDGKEWHGQDLFQSAVWDDIYGEVWGLDANHSLLHPNCRCQLDVIVKFHLDKIEVYDFTVGRKVTLQSKVFTILSANISELRGQMRGFFAELKQGLPVVREMNESLTIYFALSRRAGLPEPWGEAIRVAQQYRIVIQQLTRSIYTLMTTTGPWGLIIGVGGLVLTSLMFADQMEMRRPTY